MILGDLKIGGKKIVLKFSINIVKLFVLCFAVFRIYLLES